MNRTEITGLIAAPYTPFDNNGNLNLDLVASYAQYLKAQGVSGVFVGGTTGEGMLMDISERKALLEAWMPHKDEDFKVICHAGATSYKDNQQLAAHAESNGATAISVMGPMFLKPNNVSDLIKYCREVTNAAPKTDFYYYHIPSVSGVQLSMHEFLQEAESELSTLKGIKFTDANFLEMNLCLNAHEGKWTILHGQDETLLAGLALGVKGGVGSTYNYMAPLYLQIIEAFDNGDISTARSLQYLAAKFIEYLIAFGGGVIGGKPLMRMVGLDCGPLRSPAGNLSQQRVQEFESIVKELNLLQYMLSPVKK
ncbi:dihydrodipicolinate synthase family protein [Membranihabitans marinus]|uniref:dihydrodipicolinate synthase family protein n=1 Tax=Membranihabitans marinus TaxID=1227546 RepID=UPI001F02216D|nr:dihydrodipicolinate synthase family protein [Membranihabitans marinus]